ncbi:MOXD1 homolog 2-like [Actinia tenebrosa]|uniref:MOXD1 homolog 2-like n=1 Tax=Actinia tenebrosa TaxID=6105 RepID=A0A6P8HP27_ACTTE|nr:MOXD1 homolog 2-like [Actinia tenebrosa]
MFAILGIFLAVIQLSRADLSNEYKNNVKLDDAYMMYWTYNSSEAAVYFAVKAKAMGWVGFGFANKIDNMKNYDVTVGYVTVSKNSYDLRDYHTEGHVPPKIDTTQSLEDPSAIEADGYTTLKFKRRLDTKDKKEDITIKPGSMIVVWSYNKNADDVTKKHDKEGHQKVTLIPGAASTAHVISWVMLLTTSALAFMTS